MNEPTVGLRRPRHGTEPAIADDELLRESLQDGDLVRREAPHGSVWILGIILGIARYEPRVVDRRVWLAAHVLYPLTAELLEDALKPMLWVMQSSVRSTSQHGVGDSVVRIRLRPIQSIYGSRLTLLRVGPGDTREPKHVIERAVLEHQHEYVLDPGVRHDDDTTGGARRIGRFFAPMVAHDSSFPG